MPKGSDFKESLTSPFSLLGIRNETHFETTFVLTFNQGESISDENILMRNEHGRRFVPKKGNQIKLKNI